MYFIFFLILSVLATNLSAQPHLINSPTCTSADLLSWKKADIKPVSPVATRHSIHSYYLACPESPDGTKVLYFTSTTEDAQEGELRVLDRKNGKERLIASGIIAEDAHRVACQQWFNNGKTIVYHDFRKGQWIVVAVDVKTGREKILVKDRLLGFGTPHDAWAPVYGPHWKQGEHRDMELVHVETGEIKTVLTVNEVIEKYGDEIVKLVGEGETSIFFPVISPDRNKVMFKIARGKGDDNFRSSGASRREGKFVYDLAEKSFIRLFTLWGHPSWTPNSNGIFEKGNILFNVYTGESQKYAPGSPSNHPSLSPDSKLFVTDADISWRESGKPGEWGIIIGSLETNEFITFYRFDNSDGAKSWRVNDPHPVFSADQKRIYFNVNTGGLTRLYVAEIK